MSITVELGPHKNPRIDPLTDAECLQWVLAFIRLDLGVLREEEIETLGDDLLHATVSPDVREKPCPEIPAIQVIALQHEIRQGIQCTLTELVPMTELAKMYFRQRPPAGWTVQLSAVHVCRVGYDGPDGYFRILCMGDHAEIRDSIVIGVINLLSKFGDRLRLCRVCGTPFLRQYRQEYCQVKCSNKVRNRRRLDRKADQQKAQLATV